MNVRWLVSALFVGLAACSPPGRVELPSAPATALPRLIAVEMIDRGTASIRQVPLEEYVQGVVLSEYAPAVAELAAAGRMYEVQAVISRTYALSNLGRHARDGYDVCATTHCQLYEPARLRTSRWARAAIEAVQRTEGTVLWYEAAPARALFHADCGGHTSAAAAIWGGRDQPYLSALSDDGPAATAHSSWRYEVPVGQLLRALNQNSRTHVGNRLDAIEVLERDVGGRAERVALHGDRDAIVRGEELREVLTRVFGTRTIRSTRFAVERRGAIFTFEGQGFGHGVGLCQAGALARLRAGVGPAAVLQRYFPGTTVLTLSSSF